MLMCVAPGRHFQSQQAGNPPLDIVNVAVAIALGGGGAIPGRLCDVGNRLACNAAF